MPDEAEFAEAPYCPHCGCQLGGAWEDMRQVLATAERDMRRLRLKVHRLESEQDTQLREHPKYDQALEVLSEWRDRCRPKARDLTSSKRVQLVLARLEHYTVDELKEAVRGYAARPFVSNGARRPEGLPDQRHDDVELIFRGPKQVDYGIRLAAAERASESLGTAPSRNGRVTADPDLGEFGASALRLARAGLAVFPVLPGGKRPFPGTSGYLDATSDIQQVAEWWRESPAANVGLPTGARNGIVVLDVDGDGSGELRALERRYGELPPTTSVVTPRGGQHYYFRHPGVKVDNTQGVPAVGLDVRGDGGYVLVPPSVVEGRRYERDDEAPLAPAPAWLLRLLADYQVAAARAIDDGEWGKIFAGVQPGQRNGVMTRVVGSLTARNPATLVYGLALGINARFCHPPLPEREVRTIVKSILGREARKS